MNCTKVIVRRQVENQELTNTQVLMFDGDELVKHNLNVLDPYNANKVEECAHKLGMTLETRRVDHENAFISIHTWTR